MKEKQLNGTLTRIVETLRVQLENKSMIDHFQWNHLAEWLLQMAILVQRLPMLLTVSFVHQPHLMLMYALYFVLSDFLDPSKNVKIQ